jgi:pimeloyl-ACP methyl ester carboxylesterase
MPILRHAELVSASMLALALPSVAQAQAPAPQPIAVDYTAPANWLCLPGRKDVCSTPVATTALNPNGYGSSGPSSVARDPPIDCFYVYPTVSRDPGLNSDLNVGASEEKFAASAQFARFAGVCRTFAPIYRQMTLGAIAAMATGGDIAPAAQLAYGDVAAAWRDYLAHRNGGRPFVLIGHSQGSALLQQLIAREIEGKAIAKRMNLAILPGYNVLVPQGRLVGGTFKSTPLCSSPTETGCVMAWSSYRERNVPPAGAMFGYAAVPGMTVGCVNPGRPGATGWVPLDSYWYARSSLPVAGGPVIWSTEGPPPTPYVRTEGLVSARCVNNGPRGYLEVRTNADPKDSRTDRIGGEVGALGMFLPGWGMHLADMNIAQGNLIASLERLSRQSETAARRSR